MDSKHYYYHYFFFIINITGRGILIHIKSELRDIVIDTQKEFQEQLWIDIELDSNKDLLLGCIYRSPKHHKS